MRRLYIAVLCALAAAGLLMYSNSLAKGKNREDALRDLGVGLIEVALTVAIVEWQLDRQRLREEAMRTALNAIGDIDYAVWVWLGGKRQLNLKEMYALLEQVNDDDKLAYFTENLIMVIGSKASQTRRLRLDLTKMVRGLELGFIALEPLAAVRDAKEQPLQPRAMAQAIIAGCKHLQEVLESRELHSQMDLDSKKVVKQSDFAHQYWRDRGDWPNKYDAERMTLTAEARSASGA